MTDRPPPPNAAANPWWQFIQETESLRPDLYRYCRYLTASPWDAEDLEQETLLRAHATRSCTSPPIQNLRAWTFRVASNLALNSRRRLPWLHDTEAREPPVISVDAQATREALGTLLAHLAPQERAAIVLKDVFGFELGEVASMLSTTEGAVKSALHRGRGKLVDLERTDIEYEVTPELHEFVAAFNARDLDRLTALLSESVTIEFPGLFTEMGAETARHGSLRGILFGNPAAGETGITAPYRDGLLPQAPRLELRPHRGEPLLLAWFAHEDGERVRAITRLTFADDRVTHMRTYLHQPEVLTEICRELDVPFRASGYRFW